MGVIHGTQVRVLVVPFCRREMSTSKTITPHSPFLGPDNRANFSMYRYDTADHIPQRACRRKQESAVVHQQHIDTLVRQVRLPPPVHHRLHNSAQVAARHTSVVGSVEGRSWSAPLDPGTGRKCCESSDCCSADCCCRGCRIASSDHIAPRRDDRSRIP